MTGHVAVLMGGWSAEREEVRRRVLEETGVELHWEIRRIGVPSLPKAREVTP